MEVQAEVVSGGEDVRALADVHSEKQGLVPGSKLWASRIRRRAKELVSVLDMGYMELARILYQVYDTPVDGDPKRGPIYTAWGFNSFSDYAEKELGLEQRNAERLRQIWFTLEVQLGDMDPSLKQRIVNLGCSKVRELVRVLTIRNAGEWVSQAEHMTYRQLLSAIIEERRKLQLSEAQGLAAQSEASGLAVEQEAGLPVAALMEEKRAMNFQFFPVQEANVRLALDKAAKLSPSDSNSVHLDLICLDFLASNDFIGSDRDGRLRYIAKMERVLGLKLVAVDTDAKEVVYGIEALEAVARG